MRKGLITAEKFSGLSERTSRPSSSCPALSTAEQGLRCLRPRGRHGRGQDQPRPPGRPGGDQLRGRQRLDLPHQAAADAGHHSLADRLRGQKSGSPSRRPISRNSCACGPRRSRTASRSSATPRCCCCATACCRWRASRCARRRAHLCRSGHRTTRDRPPHPPGRPPLAQPRPG